MRTTPEETFVEARSAMECGDWDGVFACLVPDNLLKIAENGVARFLIGNDTVANVFDTLCAENDVPKEKVAELRAYLLEIGKSADESRVNAVMPDPTVMMQHSLRHQRTVAEYRKALKDMIRAVRNLSRFTAVLERALRATSGGGSVSSRLFVGEVLDGVSIAGSKAWGARRTPEGASEGIGFVERKGVWYIHLFAKPPVTNR